MPDRGQEPPGSAGSGAIPGRAARRFDQYSDPTRIDAEVRAGRHREVVGGLWDELGELQLRFLVSRGLRPTDRLLDVGCGSLRAGVRLASYLDPGNYFGIDLHESLIDVGYRQEILPAGLGDRLPRANLRATGDFEARFAAPIDVALANSVFTHLPVAQLRRCLTTLEPVVRVGGRFFVTYFESPVDHDFDVPFRQMPGGVVTGAARDPYHYRPEHVVGAANGTGWEGRIIGAWAHPRNQQMSVFERV